MPKAQPNPVQFIYPGAARPHWASPAEEPAQPMSQACVAHEVTVEESLMGPEPLAMVLMVPTPQGLRRI